MVTIGHSLEHPGVILKEEFMEPLGISQSKLAREIGVSFVRINEIVRCKRGFTPDTAIRVAKYFGNTPEFWLHWQSNYDLQKTLSEHKKEYRRISSLDHAVGR